MWAARQLWPSRYARRPCQEAPEVWPNLRLQRTRWRSPLSRQPLGAAKPWRGEELDGVVRWRRIVVGGSRFET